MNDPRTEYLVHCPTCTAEFDAVTGIWCSCDPQNPTKLCPFCLNCFCEAQESFRDDFWKGAPAALLDERNALKEARLLLGDMLVRAGVITTDQLVQGLKLQKTQGCRLGDALIALGFLSKDRIDEFLRMQQSVVSFDLSRVVLDLGLIRQVGVEFCRRKRILPLEKESFKNRVLLTMAMANPADADTINRVQRMSGCQVVAGRAPEETILEALEAHFPEEAGARGAADLTSARSTGEDDAQRVAGRLLRTGLERGAEEIRLSRQGEALEVRYRIGGRVYRAGSPPGTNAADVLGWLRRLARLDGAGGAEVRVRFAGEERLLRVESAEEADGESITLRPS